MNRFFIILLYFCLSLVQAEAQVIFQSLADATAYAFAHRPDLQNQELRTQIADQNRKQALSALYPQLKATTAFDYFASLPVQLLPAELINGEPGQLVAVQFGTRYNLSVGLEAALPLVNTQAWQNRRIAEAEEQASRYSLEGARQTAAEEIARAYYLSLLSKDAIELSAENARINDTLVQTARFRYENGVVEPLELNRLLALQLESKQQLADNKATFQNNLSRLKALCGLNPQDELSLTQKITDTPSSLALELAAPLEQHREYLALQWRTKAAEEEQQKQKLRWVPEVSVVGRFTQQAQRNQFNFFETGQPWYQIGVVGLRADWVLFSGFNRTNGRRIADLNRQISLNNLRAYALNAQNQLMEINTNYRNALESLATYRAHYGLYQENYQIAVYKYGQEVYSVDQLLQVYAEKLRSQNQYLNAMANYYVNHALLQIKNQYAQPETR